MIINPYLFAPTVDADAQAFITAAGITDSTQQSAIITLVTDLKGYNIWTKFKAIYPIVGGTEAQHKWNLKDPRDLDAAFRLQFTNAWTHSSTGMTPSNAFANTFLNANSILTQNSTHISYYSRTNSNGTEVEMGGLSGGSQLLLEIRTSNVTYFVVNMSAAYPTYSDLDSRAFYVANRTASNVINGWKNGVKVASNTTGSTTPPNFNLYLGAYNNGAGTATAPTTKQCAFASIGDGLSDTEAANFYTAVQNFQVTLGRSIGTQTVSDADAQAFVNAANITDQVQANAINNLVIGMKADGLWTKMKAIYPIVGGTEAQHKWNLKDPRDLDAAFRLQFTNAWTHSSTGMTPSSAYANTYLTENTSLNTNDSHISIYSRTNINAAQCDIGAATGTTQSNIFPNFSGIFYPRVQAINSGTAVSLDTRGLFLANRVNSTQVQGWRNTVKYTISSNSTGKVTVPFWLGDLNVNNGSGSVASTRQLAFASIGDGLTDTEAANLYNRVQTFQTTLGRQV